MKQATAAVERLQAQLEDAKRQEAAARAVLDAQRRAARSGELLSPQEIKQVRRRLKTAETHVLCSSILC
jgi:hypothetical protein